MNESVLRDALVIPRSNGSATANAFCTAASAALEVPRLDRLVVEEVGLTLRRTPHASAHVGEGGACACEGMTGACEGMTDAREGMTRAREGVTSRSEGVTSRSEGVTHVGEGVTRVG